MVLFGYAVTRPIKLGKWTLVGLLLFALLYLGTITILNLVAVGYENVEVSLNSYNSSLFLWYEHILPAGWAPPTTICIPVNLAVNEGLSNVFQFWILIVSVDNKWVIRIQSRPSDSTRR